MQSIVLVNDLHWSLEREWLFDISEKVLCWEEKVGSQLARKFLQKANNDEEDKLGQCGAKEENRPN